MCLIKSSLNKGEKSFNTHVNNLIYQSIEKSLSNLNINIVSKELTCNDTLIKFNKSSKENYFECTFNLAELLNIISSIKITKNEIKYKEELLEEPTEEISNKEENIDYDYIIRKTLAIIEMMKKNSLVLGGESSGHIINKTIVPYGDGLSNALELIKVLVRNRKRLVEYTYDVKMHFSKVVNLHFNDDDFEITEKARDKVFKFANRKNITVILRKSGTEKAINYEIDRQIELVEAGEKIVQETRRWDDETETSISMRSKENAQDYRYFPEPDLVAIKLTDEYIEKKQKV